jgi:hypothetical protein
MNAEARTQALRVFEETLEQTRYAPKEPVLVACTVPGADGQPVTLAEYWVYPDGHFLLVEEYKDE